MNVVDKSLKLLLVCEQNCILIKMCEDEKTEKGCQGVKKNIVDLTIRFDNHEECLFSQREQMRKIIVISSRRHELFTEEINKVASVEC